LEANLLKYKDKRRLQQRIKKKKKEKKDSDSFEELTIKSVLIELPFALMVFFGAATILIFLFLFLGFFLQFLF